MKRIYFDDMKDWIWLPAILLSLILILASGINIIKFEDPLTNKLIFGVGFLIPPIYFSKMYWHKYYIQWNRIGIVIRIDSWVGKSLRFDQIKSTELNGKKLTIIKTDGKEVGFDLSVIMEPDIQKLYKLINENTMARSK